MPRLLVGNVIRICITSQHHQSDQRQIKVSWWKRQFTERLIEKECVM